ncbi:bis(5'-nucleosyl)-tetraphosphatase (symmetrical) ApaH [Pantoea sp. Mhis]|uniref:bis(5'-nucleosyl)-tetraphosphatase (symmetrical) ApaH n=1 Tax=Pantoea sp. Mhis TaxID=2576759 RepID=UPI0013588E93|nr:bis(5'-nucleosyl)-tetraphosphatase (symmetrical) ApaH [Pantoea sp. Mhis]MXP56477.1 bis(5'-nucleosyl)-tetraphosphatase (symmetrical) [Pantoea sp. Mhis]
MSTYLIGDIHGCYDELCILLDKVKFNPSNDQLWLTGDLVGRGPKPLEVLRYVKYLGECVHLVLGNHDLNLLSLYKGIVTNQTQESLNVLLKNEDIDEFINWLRCQPLYQIDEEKKLLMTHAGITPQWDLDTTKMCANEITKVLSSDDYPLFLHDMYGNMPNSWTPKLEGINRLRFSINALTRMRFCSSKGQLNMLYKKAPNKNCYIPNNLKPWFLIPRKLDDMYTIVFGHWAALEGKGTPNKIIGLDTGCCWGGSLTLLHWETKKYYVQSSLSSANNFSY